MSWRNHDKDIRDLCIQDTFGPTDTVPVYSGTNRDDRGVTGQAIADYLAATYPGAAQMVTQYWSPNGAGLTFSIAQVNGISVPVWLNITPTGDLASGTVTFPPLGVAVDRQEILVTTSHAFTTLNIVAVGSILTFSFYTLGANGSFRQKFDAPSNTWKPIA